MKRLVDLNSWNRKEHYLFFSKLEEPFYGITAKVDCTKAYNAAKNKGASFFLYYLYRALKAANTIDNFRYRIINKQVYEFELINACPTIKRPNNTFGFSYMDYHENELDFYENALIEIERVQNTNSLLAETSSENVIQFSAIPWIDFTSVSHARSFSQPDSCPKISFGKVVDCDGVKTMSVGVYVHHALVDAYHIGLFFEKFQEFLND